MQGSKICGCVIGNNSFIGEGCTVEKSLVLGNDYYTNEKTRAASREKGESALGVGMCLPLIMLGTAPHIGIIETCHLTAG